MRYLPEDNLAYPVLIKFPSGGSGSGFLLNYNDKLLFLVTAKHVVYKKYDKNELILNGESLVISAKDKNPALLEPIRIEVDLNKVKIIASGTADVALIFLGRLSAIDGIGGKLAFVEGVRVPEREFSFVLVDNNNLLPYKDVLISNEAIILGYPTSIGNDKNPQIDYEQPLLRKGIIAGKNDKRKSIILDCPVYQGNSGGLVMQADTEFNGHNYGHRFRIIGIVTEFIPFFEVMYSLHHGYSNQNIENSGYSVVVPSDHILEVVSKFNEILK